MFGARSYLLTNFKLFFTRIHSYKYYRIIQIPPQSENEWSIHFPSDFRIIQSMLEIEKPKQMLRISV